jgi:hypothetical protein
VITLGTKGTPATAEMLATSGTESTIGTQATTETQATTVTLTAAEKPERVLTPTTREFSRKLSKKLSERRKL